MPNSPIFKNTTQSSIEYFISFINERVNYQNPTPYIILEWISPNEEPTIYELYNLEMELENGIVISTDIDEKLWNEYSHSTIHSFLAKDIELIQFHSSGEYITISLFGDSYDGYIRIYY